jgi:hypothetical protein
MTYSNAQEARRDLIEFGARPLLHAIAERLSMDDVLPRGRHVEFDTDAYIGDLADTHNQTPADNAPANDSPPMGVPNNA